MPRCAVCGVYVSDYLLHLRLEHDLTSATEFEEALKESNQESERAVGFHAYVQELIRMREAGKITAEEFRQRSDAWVAARRGGDQT